ncbi:MAG: hypothetical protein A2Y66_03225 [Nitrospirae bacterium RBG_13_41_22]|nr:MAG: hypothetical protein A2Y66_03225 [Nitrospirae bacterium RBG_13_41_22]
MSIPIPDFTRDGKVLIVAEVANAHQGSMEQAEKLLKSASEVGADAVKYQMFTANELCAKTHSRYEHFKKLELSGKKIKRLFNLARENKLLFFCDAFGTESADFLMSLPADGIKVHSADLSNIHLLRRLSEWNGIILLSCGGASEIEMYRALSILNPDKQEIVLLHGFQGFPTPLEETHLKRIAYLEKTFNLPVGYMDHVDAEDEMAFTLPLLAISAGATVIEKHITLNRSLKGIDYYSSLNPDEMKEFVYNIRRAEKAMGTCDIHFGPEEKEYRKKMKKQLVASRAISAGSILKEPDLTYKRAEDTCYPLNISHTIGRRIKQNISQEEVIKLSYLSLKVGILIIARMNSSRLPGKALIPILNKPAILYLIERAKLCKSADVILLCTTTNKEDDALAALAAEEGIKCYRGEEIDVLKRILGACEQEQLDIAARITGDDIFLSPSHLDETVYHLMSTNSDYCHNKSLPSGTECEVFTVESLRTIYNFAEHPENTEYLTYFVENENFQKSELPVSPEFRRDVSLTLDTSEDLGKITFLLRNIYRQNSPFTQEELIQFIDRYPDKFKTIGEARGYSQLKDSPNCRLNFWKR